MSEVKRKASWLVGEHRGKSSLEPPPDLPVVVSPIIASEACVEDWLGGVDCLLTEAMNRILNQ